MKSNGGQAFPNFPPALSYTGNLLNGEEGMTLRDYYAGIVLQAAIMSPNLNNMITPEGLSKYAYKMADALLVEREK